MLLKFIKMSSLGHDFVVMDLLTQSARAHHLPVSVWADPQTGIGFTYLLLIEQPQRPTTDFSLRVLDAQGNDVGNVSGAVACATRYVLDRGLTGQTRIKFFIGGQPVNAEAKGQRVRMNKGRPVLEPAQIPFQTDRYKAEYDLPITGLGQVQLGVLALANAHVVARTDELDRFPVDEWGNAIQQQENLPTKSRFSVIQTVTEQDIRLACQYSEYWDESACAAVVSAQLRNWVTTAVTVLYAAEEAYIEWGGQPQQAVYLTCSVKKIYEGRIIF